MATSGFGSGYDQLSLRDLLDARDQYHIHLMRHPNVVATAVGRYRIRTGDSYPTERGEGKVHGAYVRTLANSEVRYYSWPALLVFVERWVAKKDLQPHDLVPSTLYLPDGRRVPVCVIEAPKEDNNEIRPLDTVFPVNNIGGGWPIIAENQGRRYVATIACLVSDGHSVYALTNRHVTGEAGEIIYSRLGGRQERIGVSSDRHLTRALFTSHYPGWPGRNVYVNLDVGLVDIDNLDRWTAKIRTFGQMGKMVDLSVDNISLSLIGAEVCGLGAASGEMRGEIGALFYRYKTNGGFEYVADLLIGPRPARRGRKPIPFATHPGDSGTLWLLEKPADDKDARGTGGKQPETEYLPLAMQWGRNMLESAGKAQAQSYVLATFLSKVCADLGVDPVRNWNLDQPDTWSAIGHFSIASRAQVALSKRSPRLVKLLNNNADIISHDDATILEGNFTGMGEADFVALADVPDFYWKPRIAKQGFARTYEGSNHFADMDQPDEDGRTLLSLCKNAAFIDPQKWDAFYDSIVDLNDGQKIKQDRRGLLPFRVWQTFDAMVDFAAAGKGAEFVCAAGTLTHYIGDACQPLHISYLHDGDPLRQVEHRITRGERKGQVEMRRFGEGVHAGYEDAMVSAFRKDVLDGLLETPKTKATEMISTGFEAAKLTVQMMRQTVNSLPPMAIVDLFGGFQGKPKERTEALWKKFGTRTIKTMQRGAHLLAVLWESAWRVGGGETRVTKTSALTQQQAMLICSDPQFIPSVTISRVGAHLRQPD